ncbi:hypothetical protein [Nocardia noduli]|uniref:hypothetical protein n=1 Tax=Nocardia noduli TaxID=2815722 RepID=UPI001C2344C5|nr:hypothetical protein [Nocardia noduli]
MDDDSSSRLNGHLVELVLNAVDEAVSELLETAIHHQSVSPEYSARIIRLAITMMEETILWLGQAGRS